MKKEEHPVGDGCSLWPVPAETPKYVFARFSMMIRCPDWPWPGPSTPPNDHCFRLTQDDVQPCLWKFRRAPWAVNFQVVPFPTRCWLWIDNIVDGARYFASFVETIPDEGFLYNNEMLICAPGEGAQFGIGTVTWTQEATDLLASLNIERADDLFMELRPLVDGNKVYKFCRLRDATNIAIEFEPD